MTVVKISPQMLLEPTVVPSTPMLLNKRPMLQKKYDFKKSKIFVIGLTK